MSDDIHYSKEFNVNFSHVRCSTRTSSSPGWTNQARLGSMVGPSNPGRPCSGVTTQVGLKIRPGLGVGMGSDPPIRPGLPPFPDVMPFLESLGKGCRIWGWGSAPRRGWGGRRKILVGDVCISTAYRIQNVCSSDAGLTK